MDGTIPLEPGLLTVDRFEGDYLVLVARDGRSFDLPRSLAPRDARAGDVLALDLEHGEGWTRATFRIDPEATRKAHEAVVTRLDRLRARDAGGDRIV